VKKKNEKEKEDAVRIKESALHKQNKDDEYLLSA